ncbi:glycosyltransferase [Belliella sp. R4-6]|uniref:Glycosyltransferase n=1 Tax=Belliella alkalica TaxID=1730871 RepID=A0ABS9VGX8_9BACT|nr:glycosyltransferase [Belliella alkalica]MCH7415694.1 glycosyltransferase [Belliella alkalica]
MIALEIIGVMLLLSQNLLLGILLKTNFKSYAKGKGRGFPSITILVSCRNEAKNLSRCLEALEALDYPENKLQIIVGDDNSTDQTALVLKSWVSGKSYAEFYSVEENRGQKKMNGKANALSQMINKATGSLLLFTDADCKVPSTWATIMVSAALNTEAGFVTGITTVKHEGRFSTLQDVDWTFTLGVLKVLSDIGLSVTSMGNNMLISKEAYNAVGGFEGIPFSLTEDFTIASSIQKEGFYGYHQICKENLIETKAQPSLSSLLEQRKRWMNGAMKLPITIKILLALQALFLPLVLLLIYNYIFLGWLFWFVKWSLQSYFIYEMKKKMNQRINLKHLIVFEIYYLFTAWATILYYFWPSKTNWKGRKY